MRRTSPNPVEPDETVAPHTMAAPALCKNCQAILLGRFCVNCSQAADVHVPTTRELVHELLEGLTHSDSRLWLTLNYLWLKPGKLTEEFSAGRRVAYLPPFRLYLVLSVIFFLIASFARTNGQVFRFDTVDSSAPKTSLHHVTNCEDFSAAVFGGSPGWQPRLNRVCQDIVRDNGANLLHLAIGTMSKAMFIFLPLIALLHMLLYWRPRHRYAEHLLFFVHLHAFFFSAGILWVATAIAAQHWPSLQSAADLIATLWGWVLAVYTVIAMRRVFRRSWANTCFKAMALFFVYTMVFGITTGAVFVYAMLQL